LEALGYSTADMMSVTVEHRAIGMARVVLNRVRMQDNGDQLVLYFSTRFGQRNPVFLSTNQIDSANLRQAVQYLDRAARALPGDPTSLASSIPPRHYGRNTTWRPETADAFTTARHAAVAALVDPVLYAGLTTSAFVGVYAHTLAHADKEGIVASGQETDAEVAVSAWTADGTGMGWAGQASRAWTTLDPGDVAARAIELTQRSARPVAFEPGHYTAILDRPAVAQIVQAMGSAFDAWRTYNGYSPLYNPETHQTRLGERIMDSRLMLTSDPEDLEGGMLPFTRDGDPLIPMTWIDRGVHAHLAFDPQFAARMGYAPPNGWPRALRLTHTGGNREPATAAAMIAHCEEGIYVNRFSHIEQVGPSTVGTLTGLTSGGCFLVRHGAIEKPIKNLRFLESPWIFLNRVEAIGTSARAPFG
jgi:predicted Zn-dependent protease